MNLAEVIPNLAQCHVALHHPILLQQPPAQCDCLISGLPASNFVSATILDRKVRAIFDRRDTGQLFV
ncbi:hypothetical protein J6590_045734 [Homalodisca vitripennis]|nr:hypothetical protein J6590_045734 [Homalodisca vitripennis]